MNKVTKEYSVDITKMIRDCIKEHWKVGIIEAFHFRQLLVVK